MLCLALDDDIVHLYKFGVPGGGNVLAAVPGSALLRSVSVPGGAAPEEAFHALLTEIHDVAFQLPWSALALQQDVVQHPSSNRILLRLMLLTILRVENSRTKSSLLVGLCDIQDTTFMTASITPHIIVIRLRFNLRGVMGVALKVRKSERHVGVLENPIVIVWVLHRSFRTRPLDSLIQIWLISLAVPIGQDDVFHQQVPGPVRFLFRPRDRLAGPGSLSDLRLDALLRHDTSPVTRGNIK